MSIFCNNAIFFKFKTKIPSTDVFWGIKLYGHVQSSSPNILHFFVPDSLAPLQESFAQNPRILNHSLFQKYLYRLLSQSSSQGVSSVSGAVVSWLYLVEHLVGSQNTWNWHKSSREWFPQADHVRLDSFPFAT